MFFIIYCLGGQFHIVYEIRFGHSIYHCCGAAPLVDAYPLFSGGKDSHFSGIDAVSRFILMMGNGLP